MLAACMSLDHLLPETFRTPSGRSWHWPGCGVGARFVADFCEGGRFYRDDRYDSEFMLWHDELERVVIVCLDGDLTIFEPAWKTDTARLIREVLDLPDALQLFFDARGNRNRDQSTGDPPNPFS